MPNIPSYLLFGLQNSMNGTSTNGNSKTPSTNGSSSNMTTEESQRQSLLSLNPFIIQQINNQSGRFFPIKNKKEETETKQKKKIKPKIKDIPEAQEITKIFSESLLDDIIDKEVDKMLNDFISKFSTEKANILHEIDETRQDKIRKEISSQWDNIEEKQNWRLSWLNIRIEQLNQELSQTNQRLSQIQNNLNETSSRLPEIIPSENIKNNIIQLEEYPPQMRVEDVKNHPIFSTFNSTNNTKFIKEEVINSLKLFTTDYHLEKKKKQNLSINTKLSSTDGKKRKTKSESTPSRKKHKKHGEFDMDDIVVPWNDLRSNFIIPEIKVKDIYTPEWRTPSSTILDVNDTIFESKKREENEKEENILNDDDDDDNDESIRDRHLPLEIQERKRYELTSKKDKKKIEDVKENITQLYVQQENDEISNLEKLNGSLDNSQPTTPSKIQTRLEKFNRSWTQVTLESYIPTKIEDPKNGNYDSLPTYSPKDIQELEKVEILKKGRGRGTRKTHYFDEGYTEDDLVFLPDEEDEEDTFLDEQFTYTSPVDEFGSDFEIKDEEKKVTPKKKKGKRGRKKKIQETTEEIVEQVETKNEEFQSFLNDPSDYYHGYKKVKVENYLQDKTSDYHEFRKQNEEEEKESCLQEPSDYYHGYKGTTTPPKISKQKLPYKITYEFLKQDEENPLKVFIKQNIVNKKKRGRKRKIQQ
eukprot:gene8712-658_t